jgi:hypothetical protein
MNAPTLTPFAARRAARRVTENRYATISGRRSAYALKKDAS